MNGNWFLGFRSFAEAGFLATLALASAGVKFMTQDRDSEPSFSERLILFTRFPIQGKVKTRLIPALGAGGAAALQRRLTLRALRWAEKLRDTQGVGLEVQFEGADEKTLSHWLGDRFDFCQQIEGDLGQKMAWAFEKSFREGCKATVLIGTDCPQLTSDVLSQAFARLRNDAVVIGPAVDGGYYLIGLRRMIPELFRGVAWGTNTVLRDSLLALERTGLKAVLLEPLSDIDRAEDLNLWGRIAEAEDADLEKVSVVIPALNEASHIEHTVAAVIQGNTGEILVVDGGSEDETVAKARTAGARVVVSRPGRARQMNAGASRATGNVLVFLHADTRLPSSYLSLVASALRDYGTAAGAFRFAVAEEFPGSKFLEWMTNLRARWRQMPYGDQALFLRRSLFEALGGFADLPILEDYEFVLRLRRSGRVVIVPQPALTSGRRWKRLGLLRTTMLNQWMILGYRLGWPPEKLAATYRQAYCRPVKANTLSPPTSCGGSSAQT
jgi:rSAM/selenodomain-associated transferase 2/rSAM/selenodomain-associated transferase 1